MAAHEADRFPSNNEHVVDASLSHLNQWIIDCVEKCQDAMFIEGQGDVCSIKII
jgi:hypothetical protein